MAVDQEHRQEEPALAGKGKRDAERGSIRKDERAVLLPLTGDEGCLREEMAPAAEGAIN